MQGKAYVTERIRRVGLRLNQKERLAKRGEGFTWLGLQIHPWVALPRKTLLLLEKNVYEYKSTGIIPMDFKPKKRGILVKQWEESLKGKAVFAKSMNKNSVPEKALKRLLK